MAYTTIDNPEEYFKCVQWTGNSSEPRNIDVGFQTDINWMKDCSIGYHHRFFDSSRTTSGYGKALYTNKDSVEDHYNDHPEIDYLATIDIEVQDETGLDRKLRLRAIDRG